MGITPTPSYGGSPDITPAWVAQLAGILAEREDGRRPEDATRQAASELASLHHYAAHWISTIGRDASRALDAALSRAGGGYSVRANPALETQTLHLEIRHQQDGAVLSYTLELVCDLDGIHLVKTVCFGGQHRPRAALFQNRHGASDPHEIFADDVVADVVGELARSAHFVPQAT